MAICGRHYSYYQVVILKVNVVFTVVMDLFVFTPYSMCSVPNDLDNDKITSLFYRPDMKKIISNYKNLFQTER